MIQIRSSFRTWTAAAALTCAVAVSASASAAPAPAPAAATTFKLGAFQVTALADALNVLPNDGKLYGGDVDTASKLLAAAGQPTDKITLAVDALLVKTPGHVILFDTGLGIPNLSMLQASLEKAGVKPGDVTDVFITHHHGDHIGGLKTADGKSVFAKAVVHFSAKEWEATQADAGSKAVVAAISGQVKTFEPGAEVLPGVSTIELYGHTPGHTGYKITSQGKTLIDGGDIVHSSVLSLAEPGWTDAYDGDKDTGIKTREAEVKTLADSKTLVFFPHFPYPGVGHIVAAGGAYQWKPEVPAGG